MLTLLCAVFSTTWGQKVTYDFADADGNWSVSNGVLTNGTVSFSGEGGANFKMNTGYFMMGKSGAYINFPTFDFAVGKIEVVGRAGASSSTKMNIFVGDDAVSSETMGCTGTNTYVIATDYQAARTQYTLKVTSAHNAQITAIKIYEAGSEETLTLKTIAEARTQATGEVRTKGVITSLNGSDAYIQDASAAIYVYGGCSGFSIGDEIEVKGTLSNYYGLLEIKSPTCTRISQNNTVTPEVMTIAQVNASTKQGWLVKIEEATVTTEPAASTTIAQGENTIVVRDLTGVNKDDIITLTGNIGCYNAVQIVHPTDVTIAENNEPYIKVAISELTAPYKGEEEDGTVYGTFDFECQGVQIAGMDVIYISATGEVVEQPDWLEVMPSDDFAEYYVEENTGTEPRTAYFKLWSYGSAAENENTKYYSELITLTQAAYVAPPTPKTYQKVTSTADITDGNYLIVYEEGGVAFDGSLTTLDKEENKVDVTIENGVIVDANDAYFTIDVTASTIKSASGKYIGLKKYGNGVVSSDEPIEHSGFSIDTDGNAVLTITFSDGDMTLRYNSASDQHRFRYYKNGQKPVALYKEVGKANPSITVEPDGINVDCNGGGGELTTTTKYFEEEPDAFDVQFYEADGETEVSSEDFEWVTINTESMTYTIEENTGDARTAYLKIFAFDSESSEYIYSNLITINQEAYVEPSGEDWVLTDLADLAPGDVFVIVGNNGSTYAMSNDGGASSAPSAVEVTLSSNKQKITSTVTDNIKWNISGDAEDGYTFYPDGETEKWLYTINSNNGVRVGVNETNNLFIIQDDYLFNTATSRYVGIYNSQDWRCYTSINSNIEDQTFAFYKKIIEPEEIVVSFNKRAEGFSTLYCGDKNLAIPEGVNAYTYKVGEDGRYVETAYKNIIPAGSAVVLELADKDVFTGNYYDVTFTTIAATEKAHADNMLYGFDEAGHETIGPDPDKDYYFYSLSLNANSDAGSIGFYWKNADGSAFTMPANRAYLAVEKDLAGAPAFTFDGFGTNIRGINEQSATAEGVYTISGVRINGDRLSKGVYIVNGKKVVIK